MTTDEKISKLIELAETCQDAQGTTRCGIFHVIKNLTFKGGATMTVSTQCKVATDMDTMQSDDEGRERFTRSTKTTVYNELSVMLFSIPGEGSTFSPLGEEVGDFFQKVVPLLT